MSHKLTTTTNGIQANDGGHFYMLICSCGFSVGGPKMRETIEKTMKAHLEDANDQA